MSKALKCDRCGKFFIIEDLKEKHDGDKEYYYLSRSSRKSLDRPYDLCPDCYDQLRSWMMGHVTFLRGESK